MEKIDIQDNKNNIVKKHKDIVLHNKYNLSEHSIKILSMLICMIKKDDKNFKAYTINGKKFSELIGTKSKDIYKDMKKVAIELLNADIKIDKGKSVFMSKWVISAEYEKGGGFLKLKIHPELKPYLLDLKSNFMQYNIINILKLKSSYTIKLYEMFKINFSEYKYYNKQAKKYTFDVKIKELRTLFDLPNSYQYSSHIKQRILNKAQKQFKEKTDISFTYEEKKLGRRVDSLKITITQNTKGSDDYMATRRSFIGYMRKNFVNANILRTKDKYTNKMMIISIAPNGDIYDKKSTKEILPQRADEIWDSLYTMVLAGVIDLEDLDNPKI